MWDKAQFETFLQDNPPTQEQQETLALVATKLKLMPMERPWAYIKELQASFDYSKIKYTKATNKTEVDSIHTGPTKYRRTLWCAKIRFVICTAFYA